MRFGQILGSELCRGLFSTSLYTGLNSVRTITQTLKISLQLCFLKSFFKLQHIMRTFALINLFFENILKNSFSLALTQVMKCIENSWLVIIL